MTPARRGRGARRAGRWTAGLALLLVATTVSVLACRSHARRLAKVVPPAAAEYLVDDFSEPVLRHWQVEPVDSAPPTRWSLQTEDGNGYLRGASEAGAAFLTCPLDLDPQQLPVLAWRWRVDRQPDGADLRAKATDDCAARVLVTFAYRPEDASFGERLARSFAGRELPGSALCYAWDPQLPAGEVLDNPYTGQTKVVVLHGPAGLWQQQSRDVRADYRLAFGAEPPRITGIALLVDTDQTRSRAVADFDDLIFRKR